MSKNEEITSPLSSQFVMPPIYNIMEWSQSMIGNKLWTDGTLVKRMDKSSCNEGVVISEQPLSKVNKLKWGVKFHHCSGWMGVGICEKNIIQQLKYRFVINTLGHGFYGLGTNGNSYHSEEASNNNKKSNECESFQMH